MKWTENDVQALTSLAKEGKTLEECAITLCRSPDAISMKLKRLGLQAPENSSLKKTENKVTVSTATTTTRKLEMVALEELPCPNDAMRLYWAALRRLQEPDVSKEEGKRLRLIIQGVKGYIHLESDYLASIRRTESAVLSQWIHLAEDWKIRMQQANTPEEKAKYAELIRDAEREIKEFKDAGIKELR
jgi:hypothetical protein